MFYVTGFYLICDVAYILYVLFYIIIIYYHSFTLVFYILYSVLLFFFPYYRYKEIGLCWEDDVFIIKYNGVMISR